MQGSVTTSRPNTDNADVEKLQLATLDKSHAVIRKRPPSPAVYERVNVIFRPYGRKLSLKFRYFPSVRTEI